MRLYVMEKFCDFFTLRAFDLNTILTYVLMDNFCPRFLTGSKKVRRDNKKASIFTFWRIFQTKIKQ